MENRLQNNVGRLSKEQIKEKIVHYSQNYLDFIKDFGRIRVPGGIVPFKLFDFQEELITNLQNNPYNIILKARQVGISTTVGAYIGTYIIFNPQSDIIIIAINEDVAKELVLKIKIFFEYLPKYVRPKILNPRNKESIELENGSRVKALTSTSKSGRSFTASFLILDEAAFIERVDDLWTASYPTISNGGRAILLSTPNGTSNLFYDIWTAAENGDNEFTPTKIYWWQVPNRDEKWKQKALASLRYDQKKFDQEYSCNFESSSQSVISLAKINAIIRRNEQNKIKPIKEFHTKTNQKYAELSTYEHPKENARYLFAIDTAEGLGEERDASAFLGFNLMDNSVMLEYSNKELNEKQFAKVVRDVAETYNNAFLVIELKSTGKLVANYLLEWGYKNIIWIDSRMSLFLDPKTDRFVPTGNEYNKNNNIIPGFKTNTANKVVIVNEMKNAIENDEIIDIYTSKMLEQQKAFVNKGGVSMPKYAAFGRNNDDLVMCMAIGVFIKKYIWSIIENNAIFNDEVLKYFMRRTETMADSEILSEAASFSPIYNMKNFRKRINPYKSPFAEQFGDTRYLLNNYNPNKNK